MPTKRPKIKKEHVIRLLTLIGWNAGTEFSVDKLHATAAIPASAATWKKVLLETGVITRRGGSGKFVTTYSAETYLSDSFRDKVFYAYNNPKKPKTPKKQEEAESKVTEAVAIPIALDKRLEGIENTLVRFAEKLETVKSELTACHSRITDIQGSLGRREGILRIQDAERSVSLSILEHLLESLGEVDAFLAKPGPANIIKTRMLVDRGTQKHLESLKD